VTEVTRRSLGVLLICLGLVGVVGTAWAFAARDDRPRSPVLVNSALLTARGQAATCDVPVLPGQVIDVVLSDMDQTMGGGMMGWGMGGGMMRSGRMMAITTNASTAEAGQVSFRVRNAGWMVHELVVLPLDHGGVGTRSIGRDGRVSEVGAVGEVSNSCGETTGEGIAPGGTGWVTMQLAPGRYELLCNLPGHYGMGMFTEFDVR
jgi:uncharacterized cupredoxin-like copper-binding protein